MEGILLEEGQRAKGRGKRKWREGESRSVPDSKVKMTTLYMHKQVSAEKNC